MTKSLMDRILEEVEPFPGYAETWFVEKDLPDSIEAVKVAVAGGYPPSERDLKLLREVFGDSKLKEMFGDSLPLH